jgi:hypothetical protein
VKADGKMTVSFDLVSRRAATGGLLLACLMLGFAALAADSGARLAIKGYDPVAYFTLGKATPGSSDIAYEWDGTRWQFADAAHRDLFQRDPEAYAPQYGGYCALGMTAGNRGEPNPEVWAIVDGKLYFNYDEPTQDEWRQNEAANIAQADRVWAERQR